MKITLLANFEGHNTILLTLGTLLHSRYLELIHSVELSLQAATVFFASMSLAVLDTSYLSFCNWLIHVAKSSVFLYITNEPSERDHLQ